MKKNLKITEEDLDTTPNLSTLNYLLGLIGLKDNMDMRVFSRNFIKIDKLLKDIFDGISAHIKVLATKTQDGHMSKEDKTKLDGVAENANNYKLPNASTTVVGGIKVGNNLQITADGTLSGPAGYSHPTSSGNKHIPSGGAVDNFIKWASDGTGTWGLINWDIIQNKPSSFTPASHTHDDRYFTEGEINEKFKNFCPIVVGALLILDSTANPATLYPNTTWSKIENRFLYGSASPSVTGGSKKISIDNLEPFTPIASQEIHIHANIPHKHGATTRSSSGTSGSCFSDYQTGGTSRTQYTRDSDGNSTGEAQPKITIQQLGRGEDYMPPYYTVCIWKRLT